MRVVTFDTAWSPVSHKKEDDCGVTWYPVNKKKNHKITKITKLKGKIYKNELKSRMLEQPVKYWKGNKRKKRLKNLAVKKIYEKLSFKKI